MGQVAAALGVTPGTATTMVKALAESGLAEYEPYSGVRLSAAGEKLAGLVLRRHRLVELFLVQVMGMSWAEVHDDAEQLEHVVSERLIDRIDEMLGRPTHDPHGDPIPNPDGAITATASRQPADLPARHAAEGDAHHRSGSGVPALHREATTSSPASRSRSNRAMTPPTRCVLRPEGSADHDRRARRIEAAGRGRLRLIRLRRASAACCSLVMRAAALHAAGAPASSRLVAYQWEITDNSFLVEEAFNQEAGVVQNILTWTRGHHGTWDGNFTQEWPAPGHGASTLGTRSHLRRPRRRRPGLATCC